MASAPKMSEASVAPHGSSRSPSEPLLKWAGGKRWLAPQLVETISRTTFARYFEPFCGGAALFFHLAPKQAILSDTNKDLINCYKQIRDNPETVIAALRRHKNTERHYYAMREMHPRCGSTRAARMIYLTTLAFNGIYRVNLRGEFNVPYGYKKHVIPCNAERIRRAAEQPRHARLVVGDFEDIASNAVANDLLYFDPPYTVAHGNNGFLKYNEKILQWEDQLRLACVATSAAERGCKVIVSNADHPSLRKLYSHFRKERVRRPSQTVLSMFISKIALSDNDKARARQANVVLLDEQDLTYYETLIGHLGNASKYQFFSDLMPGKEIPGLRIRVPAIKHKMGGTHCYTFAASPEYLLKICYVSHRQKGKASDVDAYQRMVQKSRLRKIREYIANDGYFPTSILINLENRRVLFEKTRQDSGSEDSGVLGWLEIRPAYRSAWVIDGQHRLFGYSGQPRAPKSRLTVLAFAGLRPSEQARLFIEINSKQKRVPQILLQTLIAELNWDAEDDRVRLGAILSKGIQEMDADADSPFFQRIQTSEETKDAIRCITITSLHSAVEKSRLHIVKEKQGRVVEYGPLWAGDNKLTLIRTNYILNGWFTLIKSSATDWWSKGANPGGGLAMNDGASACIGILRSVFEHLDSQGKKLLRYDNEDLFELTRKYGQALADYLGSLSEDDRRKFRDLRGVQGVTARVRRCQKAIRDRHPEFNPAGLDEYLEQEKAQTNIRAKEIIDRIEKALQRVVIEELKREFGNDDSGWWIEGVPKPVRLEVGRRLEEDDAHRGGKENYFDLIHYRRIATDNWDLFRDLLSFGKSGAGKEKATAWLNDLNDKRKIVSHASSAVSLTLEDLARLQEYENTLMAKVSGRTATATEC